jgi:hypothetical protein
MEGITLRGSSRDRTKAVIKADGSVQNLGVGAWDFFNLSDKMPTCFANLTFDFGSVSNGMFFYGGHIKMENVAIVGPTNLMHLDWYGALTYYTDAGYNTNYSLTMLDCEAHYGCIGVANYSDYSANDAIWPTNHTRAIFMGCYFHHFTNIWHDDGNTINGTVFASDGSAVSELYNCRLSAGLRTTTNNSVACLHWGRAYLFWSELMSEDGEMDVYGANGLNYFGSRAVWTFGLNPPSVYLATNTGYALFSRFVDDRTVNDSGFIQVRGGTNNVMLFHHNRVYHTGGGNTLWANTGGRSYVGNVIYDKGGVAVAVSSFKNIAQPIQFFGNVFKSDNVGALAILWLSMEAGFRCRLPPIRWISRTSSASTRAVTTSMRRRSRPTRWPGRPI